MKKMHKISKTSRKMIKVYCGIFIALSTIVAAFAWFEGTINKPGISIETGKIEVSANAYEYEDNELLKLGDAEKDNSLVLSIDKKEQKNLYIIVDRTTESLEVDYFLNLTLESGQNLTLTAAQKDELNRYLGGFSYKFYKLTDEVNNSSITQKEYGSGTTYNSYEKKLDSYISYCGVAANNHSIYPSNVEERSFAALSSTKEQDSLRDSKYANYYVFHYEYGSEIAELTDRVIQISLNINYAQVGGLTEEDRRSDVVYCTTPNQFNAAIKSFMPGQTINVTCDVTYDKDLVFNAPVNLVVTNAKLTITGSLIFSYPYLEKSTINTKSTGQIIIKSNDGNGGFLEVDVPNGSFEFVGKGANTAKPDIYVQKAVDLNASYKDGVTFSGANIYGLSSSGAIPDVNVCKDISFEDETLITIGNNTTVGAIMPYVSSLAQTTIAPHRVAIVIYGRVKNINLYSMNYIPNPDFTETVEQIFIDSNGVIDEPTISLPSWSQKWQFIDGVDRKYYTGNTTIREHFATTELDVSVPFDSTNTNPFEKKDIITDQKNTYVLVNGETSGTIYDITIYYLSHDNVNSLDLILKEFYYPSGYTDSLANDYKQKLEDLVNVEIICSGNDSISTDDTTTIKKMLHVKKLNLERAKYTDNYLRQNAYNGLLELSDLKLPTTLVKLGDSVFNGMRDLHEITLPASIVEFQGGNAMLNSPSPLMIHVLNTEKVYHMFQNDSGIGKYMLVDQSVVDTWRANSIFSDDKKTSRILSAEGSISEDGKYIYNDLGNGEYRIEKYMGTFDEKEDLIINEFSVSSGTTGKIKEIAPMAYCNELLDVTSLTIGSNVKRIESKAFRYSNIGSLTITSGVDFIGEYAFGNSNITNVTISNVGEINKSFYSLISDSVDVDGVDILTNYAFGYSTIDTASVKNIGTVSSYIFGNATTRDLCIKNVSTVLGYSFYKMKVTNELNVSGLKSIEDGYYHFGSCTINKFLYSGDGNEFVGTDDRTCQSTTVEYLSFVDTPIISQRLFCCISVNTLDLSGVREIKQRAFINATINEFTNTNDLKVLNSYAIYNVKQLKTFTSSSLETIKAYNFSACPNLEVVDVRNVREVGNYCFYNNRLLTIVYTGCMKNTSNLSGNFLDNENLKYVLFGGHYDPSDSTLMDWSKLDNSVKCKLIIPKGYFDAACLSSSPIYNRQINICYYEDYVSLNDLHMYGLKKYSDESIFNYGDGIFYFNHDLVSDETRGVTLVCLSESEINCDTYTTPSTITYGSVEYPVTRLNNVLCSLQTNISTLNIGNNTKVLEFSFSKNTLSTNIGIFNGQPLVELGDFCFFRGNYGSINIGNVISTGDRCFCGVTSTSNFFNADTVDLHSLVSSDAINLFAYANVDTIDISDLENISNGYWFYGGGTFGDIDASSLKYLPGTCFDSSSAPTQNSSYRSINLSSLKDLPSNCFYSCAGINQINLESLVTAGRVFYNIESSPKEICFPSLKSIKTTSDSSTAFSFNGAERLLFPSLESYTARINFYDGLKEFYAPMLVTAGRFNARQCQTLEIFYAPKLNSYVAENSQTCNSGVKDIYLKDFNLRGSDWLEYFLKGNYDNLYFSSDAIYNKSVSYLTNRSDKTNKINVYVSNNLYQNIPDNILVGYGYNFINTGDYNPTDLYYNNLGSTTVDGWTLTYPEYQYIEEDGGLTLINCNKDVYDDSTMVVGGKATINKVVNGENVSVQLEIKKLADYLYSDTLIDCYTLSIDSSVNYIGKNAFGDLADKTCEVLELRNTGVVETDAFSGLTVHSDLIIYNNIDLKERSLPTVDGIKVKIFFEEGVIPSTNAFGTSSNLSTLSVSSAVLSQYVNNAPWNGISSTRMSSYDSSFTVTIGDDDEIEITYYYLLTSEGLDIIYISSSSQLDEISIPSSAEISSGGSSTLKDVIVLESQALSGLGSISKVILPTTLKNYVYNSDFEPATLTEYAFDGSSSYFSTEDGVLYNADKTRLISYPKGKSGTTFTIPSVVQVISAGAFAGNGNLESVTFEDSDSTLNIASYAFKGCSKLTQMNVTRNVVLSDYAFAGSKFVTIEFDDDVTFGSYSFSNCNSLENVKLNGKGIFESYAFANLGDGIVVDFNGDIASEFIGNAIFDGVLIYSLKVPAGELANYYANVLFDQNIISHFQEKTS